MQLEVTNYCILFYMLDGYKLKFIRFVNNKYQFEDTIKAFSNTIYKYNLHAIKFIGE